MNIVVLVESYIWWYGVLFLWIIYVDSYLFNGCMLEDMSEYEFIMVDGRSILVCCSDWMRVVFVGF